ncbi:alpha-1,2-fucosyltransferase [Bacteroides nordii]|uniref:alpha-1,2-fucosyltransferase n=1 Tax=Bacteroides nordii TaxID=291645 RepID=UPI003521FB73
MMGIEKTNMVIVRLWGGIGNQLFQYSFGEFLREKYQVDVIYDIASFGKSDKLRKLELSVVVPGIPVTTDISFSKYVGTKNRLLRFIYGLKNSFIEEKYFSDEQLFKYLSKRGDVYLQGYWQKTIYAETLRRKGSFFLSQEEPIVLHTIKAKIQESEGAIALHVRRGDYFSSKHINTFGVCDAHYYEKAVDIMRGRVSNALIFVFSDDLDWVRKSVNLPINTIYVPNYGIPQYWYIHLMSLCRHNIISNSSFSWWGAFLNTNRNKIVISPSIWTLNSNKTIALDEWMRI